MRCLTIDVDGGYIDPKQIGLSPEPVRRIEKWVIEYETAHYNQFKDEIESQRLDQEGVEIARLAQEQLPRMKVDYFSNARMQKITSV